MNLYYYYYSVCVVFCVFSITACVLVCVEVLPLVLGLLYSTGGVASGQVCRLRTIVSWVWPQKVGVSP